MVREHWRRSLAKAASWRVCGSLTTLGIAWALSGRLDFALALGGLEAVGKILLYYVHERLWAWNSPGLGEPQAAVIWLTGLSGAGKSTIAEQLCLQFQRQGRRVEHLDGDTVRSVFPNTGFSRSERDQHVRRMGFLASRLERHGVTVVASFISPYDESRAFVRTLCQRYIEIYVSTPLEECERRDVKGLYARARRGELMNFTGISDPYEPPPQPELTIDTRHLSVDEAVAKVLERLTQR